MAASCEGSALFMMLASTILCSLYLARASLALPADDAVERQASTSTCSLAPSVPTAVYSPLPNPFQFADGASVATKADFDCRAQEVSAIM